MDYVSDLFLTQKRLTEWGRWCHYIVTMGLGYQHKSLLAHLEEGGGVIVRGTGKLLVPNHERAEATNLLIEKLAMNEEEGGVGKPEWAKVVRLHYTMFRKNYQTKIRVSGLTKSTYARYLREAQRWLSHELA